MYIYLDESGDLGFDLSKRGTSCYFVITLLVCHNQAAKQAIVQAIRRTVKNKIHCGKYSNGSHFELKGMNTPFPIKHYFFKQIKSSDWSLFSLILNKRRVYKRFHSPAGQGKIYNFLSKHIIEKLPLNDVKANVHLVVDKCKNRAQIVEFNRYIKNYVEGALPLNTGYTVKHYDSREDACLQAVDLFCWGIARKYKDNDTEWYDVYNNKLEHEDVYLPQ